RRDRGLDLGALRRAARVRRRPRVRGAALEGPAAGVRDRPRRHGRSRARPLVAAAPEGLALGELDALDHGRLARLVVRVGVALLDRVDGFHAAGDLAEDGVLAVEPGRSL